MRTHVTLAAVLALTVSCRNGAPPDSPGNGSAAPSADADRARDEIRRQSERHVAAHRLASADSIVAMYADDVVVQFPDIPDARGRAGARDMFASILAGMKVDTLLVTPDTIEVHGDAAYEWGTYHQVYTPQGKPRVREDGRYVIRWQRGANGTWRVSRFTGNARQRVPA